MLDGAHAHSFIGFSGYDRATLSLNHMFGESLHGGAAFQIHSAEHITRILRSRFYGGIDVKAGVQALSTERKCLL